MRKNLVKFIKFFLTLPIFFVFRTFIVYCILVFIFLASLDEKTDLLKEDDILKEDDEVVKCFFRSLMSVLFMSLITYLLFVKH